MSEIPSEDTDFETETAIEGTLTFLPRFTSISNEPKRVNDVNNARATCKRRSDEIGKEATVINTLNQGGSVSNNEITAKNVTKPRSKVNIQTEVIDISDKNASKPSSKVNTQTEVIDISEKNASKPSSKVNTQTEVIDISEKNASKPSSKMNTHTEVIDISEKNARKPRNKVNTQTEVIDISDATEGESNDKTPYNNEEMNISNARSTALYRSKHVSYRPRVERTWIKMNVKSYPQSVTIPTAHASLQTSGINGQEKGSINAKLELEDFEEIKATDNLKTSLVEGGSVNTKRKSVLEEFEVCRNTELSQTLHERDLNNSRKRKRDIKCRKGNHTGDDFDIFLKTNLTGNSKPRVGSNTSTWAINSRQSFGSNDALNSMGSNNTGRQQYSYLNIDSEPIHFKSKASDLLDIEDVDNGWDDVDDDVNDNVKETFDAWCCVKPYTVIASSNVMDSDSSEHVRQVFSLGPSSTELNTKQKLLKAKCAQRPRSETSLDKSSKPPLPPDVILRRRPASDTGSRSQYFSRYFTSNVNMHC